jgi:hypothetical protein
MQGILNGSLEAPQLSRDADRVESFEVCKELQGFGKYGLLISTEHMSKLYIGWRPPSPSQVSSFFAS